MRCLKTFDWQYISRELDLKRETAEIQSIFRTSTYCFWPLLTLRSTPTFHSAVEMYWNLIIPPSYDSLLCWLLWWLLWCVMLSQCSKDTRCSSVDTRFFFFFFPPIFSQQSSHSGEQHRATGCASWGGSGCAEEHLWYGLPQGGQAWACASQWHVRPSRLLQQYVSTSSCCSIRPGCDANTVHTLPKSETTIYIHWSIGSHPGAPTALSDEITYPFPDYQCMFQM